MRSLVYPLVKRVIDFVASAILLAVLSPLLLTVAAAILIAMGGPVMFRQDRPGLHGSPFTLVKFRTMRIGDAADGDRITRLGQFLRSTSLDELPELWNVLKGEMSLVGPRPLLMEYLPLYTEEQARRHEVRPGITGLAQVTGRNELAWVDRLATDAEYVRNQSLRLDLSVIVRTVVQVSKRSGISADGEATMPLFTGKAPATDDELRTPAVRLEGRSE